MKNSVPDNKIFENNIKILKEITRNDEVAEILQKSQPLNERDYFIEYTSTGNITIRVEDNGRSLYLSGNNDPIRDARVLVDSYINEGTTKYIIIGAGLLFEAEYLVNYRKDFEVYVIEEDAYLLNKAFASRDLSSILETGRVHLFITNSYEELDIAIDGILIIRIPNLSLVRNVKIKSLLEDYHVNEISARENVNHLIENFNRNIVLSTNMVDDIRDIFEGRNIILVAGGPSLNYGFNYIKKSSKDYVVVTVGTSAASLAMNDIIPDAIIITDVKVSMLKQLEAFVPYCQNNNKYPKLLFLSTANYEAVNYYPGERYLILQKGFKKAEELALEKGYTLFETGGSVSTTALDVLIRFKAHRIECFGLDLAYTNSMSHANNTIEVHNTDNVGADRMVKSVNGGTVGTAKNLDVYRKWIERRIADIKGVNIVNYSDGAYIEGMENYPTSEIP